MSFSLLLDLYGLRAFFSPELIAVIIVLTAAYLYATRQQPGKAPLVTVRRKILFIFGMVCLYLGWGGPLNVLGHFLFGAHMLQMAILFLAMPPLILLSLPVPWFEKLLRPKWVKKTVAVLTQPIFAILTFNFLFSLYHMPFIFDPVMSNFSLHTAVHLLLEITAFMMWWPVVCPIADMERLSGLMKIGYMFANGVLITPACALIIFADVPLYKLYTEGAALLCLPFGFVSFDTPQSLNLLPMSIREDQQAGGVIMKVTQEIIYGWVLAYNFFRWYRMERAKEENEDWDLEEMAPEPRY
ncbi:cytochrome c oxidase assembly factor CtaG [Paenibacillus sp. J2TS4]|uniref:cytochrome c oxidase assembly factor CtaG n=1 Tax=Paenibacillus sp. J2TS4 TaxID=2807194 RepID=UPI001B18C693|nr:cytochrome c oxidase assembly factor CtaG [Paenibacillus sp. J2TS4]GIP35169.1 protein CtaG [Paenibacillus sp. J2TS4]